MKLSQAAEGFLLYAGSGVYSPTYIKYAMKGRLKLMVEYFKDPEIESLTLIDLQRFMGYLATEYCPKRINGIAAPITEATRDGYWKLIRSFYNWASEALDITRPDARLDRPRYETPQVVPFTQEETKRLLDASQYTWVQKASGQRYKIRRPNGDRDKALILILLDTGMRVGELCRLRVGDINLDNGEVYIRPHRDGRKSRARTVYIGDRTKQAIWKYTARVQAGKDLTKPFVELKGSSILWLIKRIGKNAKVPNAHPHKFRHTFAISYLRNGGDVFTLQRLLGHADLAMTRKYVDLAQTDIANAHRQASPVDNWRL
jgi:integrase/recombinase XerD